MFGDNKNDEKKVDKTKVETIIGSGSSIDGNVHTKGSLRVEGEISGKIVADGDIFVGEEGIVNTEVKARNVVIAGKIEGDIIARNKLEILSTGKLYGNVKAKTLKIEEGALFNGSSSPLNNSDNENKKTTKINNKKDNGKKAKKNSTKKSDKNN